jgi:hypothetical protein
VIVVVVFEKDLDVVEKGKEKGYNDDAFRKYCIWYNCGVCDEAIIIESNSERYNLIKKISNYKIWVHKKCFQMY